MRRDGLRHKLHGVRVKTKGQEYLISEHSRPGDVLEASLASHVSGPLAFDRVLLTTVIITCG